MTQQAELFEVGISFHDWVTCMGLRRDVENVEQKHLGSSRG
jgi:hypothetical protein